MIHKNASFSLPHRISQSLIPIGDRGKIIASRFKSGGGFVPAQIVYGYLEFFLKSNGIDDMPTISHIAVMLTSLGSVGIFHIIHSVIRC